MANGLIQTTNEGARRQMLAQLLSGQLGGNDNDGPSTGMEAAGQLAQNYMLARMLSGGGGGGGMSALGSPATATNAVGGFGQGGLMQGGGNVMSQGAMINALRNPSPGPQM